MPVEFIAYNKAGSLTTQTFQGKDCRERHVLLAAHVQTSLQTNHANCDRVGIMRNAGSVQPWPHEGQFKTEETIRTSLTQRGANSFLRFEKPRGVIFSRGVIMAAATFVFYWLQWANRRSNC